MLWILCCPGEHLGAVLGFGPRVETGKFGTAETPPNPALPPQL